MSHIQLQYTFSRSEIPASSEPQLHYLLLDAQPRGSTAVSAKLPLNICFVIDRSSSMRGERLTQVKEAARRIVDQLSNKDTFCLVAFNDRAEVIVPSQRINDPVSLKQRISNIEASGGTEMAQGLMVAAQEIQRTALGRSISRLVLLTDGRTYGDESRCVQIARRAQERQIGITALGVGDEWNEDLLETIAASENSRTHFVTSVGEIGRIFSEEIQRMHSIFVQDVQMHIRMCRGGLLRSLDRVQPFLAPVPISEEEREYWVARLGDWPGIEAQSFLFELMVPPLSQGDHVLMSLGLQYQTPHQQGKPDPIQATLSMRVAPPDSIDPTDLNSLVRHWLERLVAYRLQERAWDDVADGRMEEAGQRLTMASTRLFDAGQASLATTVRDEATRLIRSGKTSAIGRKQIKYGTRGLMGPPATVKKGT